MKHILLFLSLFIASQIYGQETWNACNSTVTIIPPPSYDSTFVLSAPSRAALAKGMANWTPSTSGGASYLVYTALLTQSGTSAPVATVLENTLGATPTFSYVGVGSYTINCSSCFDATYTAALNSSCYDFGNGAAAIVLLDRYNAGDASAIYISVYDAANAAADELLNNTLIEIHVY